MRSTWIALFLSSFVAVAGADEPPARGPVDQRPNIILVVTDDQGYGDASGYWETDLRTPVMDTIAANGVHFRRFRVNPLCAPTRASLLTGLYSLETGMWRGPGQVEKQPRPKTGWPPDARRIKDDVQLLPQYLKRAGYATGVFGKWHLGYDPANVPNARGFDQFVGFLEGAHPYWPGPNSRLLHNGRPLDTRQHTTDLFADRALEFIRRHGDHPFFCYLAFNAVHGPLRNAARDADSAKPDWLARYERLGIAQPRRDYCAVMSHADARVGDIVRALQELEIETRTLLIYCSDNGGILHKYPSNNGPFRGGKGQTYEGGIRVPAVMQWPGVIPAATVCDANVMHFDLFATILDAAGISVPERNGGYEISGKSLLPLLRSGRAQHFPNRYLFWELYGTVGALYGNWKMVGQLSNHHGKFAKALEEAKEAQFELYNLAEDLGETTNVAAQHPDIYQDLKSRYLHWFEQATNPPDAHK